jgi:hypothetical protein
VSDLPTGPLSVYGLRPHPDRATHGFRFPPGVAEHPKPHIPGSIPDAPPEPPVPVNDPDPADTPDEQPRDD